MAFRMKDKTEDMLLRHSLTLGSMALVAWGIYIWRFGV